MPAKEKEYLTLQEAAQHIGVTRATVYSYIHDLNITRFKFKHDKRVYLAQADVKRMKEVKERPWLADDM